MVGRAIQKIKEKVSDDGDVDVDVQLLIRKLVNQVADKTLSTGQHESNESGNDVLLDREVDGVRCVLVRLQPKPERAHVTLSPREQEIARMVAEGYPNKTIAAVLDISSWTVCTHLRRIFAKFNVRSRAAMVARLLEEGLIGEQSKQSEAHSLKCR
ncbi:MAG TPA: LuxR C-terminal-related transcriptional regulator [Blastocatellia bacterium]|nr:LuxR C-terminal-related transcriptional regulator [Blastocatellia bacterium]